MVHITESQKILIQELIEYTIDGSSILVKTPELLFSAREHKSIIIWVVIYRGKKHTFFSCLNDLDYANRSIFNFIHDTDKELG